MWARAGVERLESKGSNDVEECSLNNDGGDALVERRIMNMFSLRTRKSSRLSTQLSKVVDFFKLPDVIDLDPNDFPDWSTPMYSAAYGSRPMQTALARPQVLILAATLLASQVWKACSNLHHRKLQVANIGNATWGVLTVWEISLSLVHAWLTIGFMYWHLYRKKHARTGWKVARPWLLAFASVNLSFGSTMVVMAVHYGHFSDTPVPVHAVVVQAHGACSGFYWALASFWSWHLYSIRRDQKRTFWNFSWSISAMAVLKPVIWELVVHTTATMRPPSELIPDPDITIGATLFLFFFVLFILIPRRAMMYLMNKHISSSRAAFEAAWADIIMTSAGLATCRHIQDATEAMIVPDKIIRERPYHVHSRRFKNATRSNGSLSDVVSYTRFAGDEAVPKLLNFRNHLMRSLWMKPQIDSSTDDKNTNLVGTKVELVQMQQHDRSNGEPKVLSNRYELFKRAREAHPIFEKHLHNLVESIREPIGGGIEVVVPELKTVERVYQKVTRHYENRFEKVKDLLRASIIVDAIEHVTVVVEAIGACRDHTVYEATNRFEIDYKHPLKTGYRDLKLVLAGPEVTQGLLCEVQIHLRSFWNVGCTNIRSIRQIKSEDTHYTYLRDGLGV